MTRASHPARISKPGDGLDLTSVRLPADWVLRPDGMVQTPFDGLLRLDDALALYACKATRSKSVDRDLRRG